MVPVTPLSHAFVQGQRGSLVRGGGDGGGPAPSPSLGAAEVDVIFSRAASKPASEAHVGSPSQASPTAAAAAAARPARRASVSGGGLRADYDQFCVALADVAGRLYGAAAAGGSGGGVGAEAVTAAAVVAAAWRQLLAAHVLPLFAALSRSVPSFAADVATAVEGRRGRASELAEYMDEKRGALQHMYRCVVRARVRARARLCTTSVRALVCVSESVCVRVCACVQLGSV